MSLQIPWHWKHVAVCFCSFAWIRPVSHPARPLFEKLGTVTAAELADLHIHHLSPRMQGHEPVLRRSQGERQKPKRTENVKKLFLWKSKTRGESENKNNLFYHQALHLQSPRDPRKPKSKQHASVHCEPAGSILFPLEIVASHRGEDKR